MVQIILYAVLAGVALFFYIVTRPKRKTDNQDVLFQKKVEGILHKIQQEQIGIAESMQSKLVDFQLRMDELEKRCNQQEEYIKELLLDKKNYNSFTSNNSIETSNSIAENHTFSPKHMQVVQLLRQGKGGREIARQTGVGIGEIELLQRLLYSK